MQRSTLCTGSSCSRSQTASPFQPASSGSGNDGVAVQALATAITRASPTAPLRIELIFSICSNLLSPIQMTNAQQT